MLSEGAAAPAVDLPAYVDGERRRVDLGEYLGEGIVVLAFYPADFNPACTMQESDLGDLDLFTMQKDVSVFGVSPDSTYSHEAFAERYGLHVPLLSDREGEATAAYGVATENEVGERLVRRSVFVVDHRGTVQYARAADDLETPLDVGPVKAAVGDIGGDDTALDRYRVGHDHYAEGREAFRAAMADYEDREWMDARNGFEEAEPAFTDAADHFDTAVRFAETAAFETVVDRTEEKADTLAHATSWLADSADALASGRGKQGAQYREDAERLLDAATDLSEPPGPDAFRLTAEGIELGDSVVVDPEEEAGYDWQADDAGGVDTGLAVDDADLDAAVAGEADDYEPADEPDTVEGDLEMDLDAVGEADDGDDESEGSSVEGDTVEGDLEMDLDAVDAATDGAADETGAGPTDRPDGSADGPDGATSGRSGSSDGSDTGTGTGDEPGDGRAAGDERAGGDPADGDDADVAELDLSDPTEGDDEDEADDERADWDIPGR
ncbi:redoxin domain-containing protein [Halosimplex pelagicum]|uniref:thioredoxin-dependent peroxiredoxin n=1 Tax=Halosimplex pelagicum TaxID=869886 RepID=A0A7D5TF91_9EURY|nr:redoxin domain-containing protein [Halosimplex pelagicum]QLH80216.1 redoxin domain-containing protein [Halosimplex pelagicum]